MTYPDIAASPFCSFAWDITKLTGYVDGAPITAVPDGSAGGLGRNLTAQGAACPIFKTNQLSGGAALFDGALNLMSAGAPGDWTWMHDGHPFTLFALIKHVLPFPVGSALVLDTSAAASANVGMSWYAYSDQATYRQYMQFRISKGAGKFNITNETPNYSYNAAAWTLFVVRHCANSFNLRENLGVFDDCQIIVNGIPVAGVQTVAANLPYSSALPHNALQVGATTASGNAGTPWYLGGLWGLNQALPLDEIEPYARGITQRVNAACWSDNITNKYKYHGGPSVTQLPDSSLCVSWQDLTNENATYLGDGGLSRKSADGGATWGPYITVCKDPGKVLAPEALITTGAGTIISLIAEVTSANAASVRRSTDGGNTFGPPILLAPWAHDNSCGGCMTKSSDGSTLAVITGTNSAVVNYGAKVMRSCAIQDGTAWTLLSTPIADNGPGQYFETGIVTASGTAPNEKMLLLVRDATAQKTYYMKSLDSGRTWGPMVLITALSSMRPSCIRTQSGKLILCTRALQGNGNMRPGLMWSADEGDHWSTPNKFFTDPIDRYASYAWVIETLPGVLYYVVSSAPTPPTTNPATAWVHGFKFYESELMAYS